MAVNGITRSEYKAMVRALMKLQWAAARQNMTNCIGAACGSGLPVPAKAVELCCWFRQQADENYEEVRRLRAEMKVVLATGSFDAERPGVMPALGRFGRALRDLLVDLWMSIRLLGK